MFPKAVDLFANLPDATVRFLGGKFKKAKPRYINRFMTNFHGP